MNIKRYEAPLHGRAKKKFNNNDSDDEEDDDEKDKNRNVSTSSGRRVRAADIEEDDEHTIDGKDFLKMIQKKKPVRSTSARTKEGSADSENVPEEKKAGRRFLREKPTRKKGSVEYFSAELDDDEKEAMKRSQQMKDTLSEEMLEKKAVKDAKFKRLLSKKSADGGKRYRD